MPPASPRWWNSTRRSSRSTRGNGPSTAGFERAVSRAKFTGLDEDFLRTLDLLGAGSTLLNWLSDQAARAGTHLVADFRRTNRNRMMEIVYRFAGFSHDESACVAELPMAGVEGIERLHLFPAEQPAPTTLSLTVPDLADVALPRRRPARPFVILR